MTLKVGVSTTLLANVVFAISQWVIIAGLNYSGKTDVVGQYAFAIAIAGLFLTIGQLGFRQYLLSSIITQNEIQYVFQMRLMFSLLTFLILIIFSYYFLSSIYFLLIIALGACKVFENLSDICHGYFQRHFQIQSIVISRLFRSITSPIFFLLIFYYTQNVVMASTGLIVSLFLTFYLFDKKALTQHSVQFCAVMPIKAFNHIIKKASPMGVATVLVILIVNIPLFILKQYVSDTALGTYASIFYFVTAGSLVLQSVMQVISPILTKHIQDQSFVAVKLLIRKSYLMALLFGLFGVFLSAVFGNYILTLLYGDAFDNLGGLIVIASVVNFTLAFQSVGGVALTSFGIFTYQMYCMFFAIPVCYLSSYFFISNAGMQGALYAGAFTSLIIAGLFYIKIFKKLKNIEKN